MSYENRKIILEKIKEIRKRPIISYVTSIRPFLSSQMAADAIPFIINQIEAAEESNEVDFVIISNGGDSITAQRIINLLREKYKKINVLIPYVAYSAATILAFGGDALIMHKYSNLGPVDPQITTRKPNDKGTLNNIQFGSEDVKYFIDFLRNDVKIKNGHISPTLLSLVNEAGPLAIGFSKRSQQLSLDLSKKLLKLHINDKKKIKAITQRFNTSYNHSYAISRTEAKEIGLNIDVSNQEVESLLWELWKDYESELKCDVPFDLNSVILSDPNIRARITGYSTIQFPVNVSQLIQGNVQQLINQQQLINTSINSTVSIDLTMGCIEGIIDAYHYRTTLEVSAWRNIDMNIGINTIQLNKGWIRV